MIVDWAYHPPCFMRARLVPCMTGVLELDMACVRCFSFSVVCNWNCSLELDDLFISLKYLCFLWGLVLTSE